MNCSSFLLIPTLETLHWPVILSWCRLFGIFIFMWRIYSLLNKKISRNLFTCWSSFESVIPACISHFSQLRFLETFTGLIYFLYSCHVTRIQDVLLILWIKKQQEGPCCDMVNRRARVQQWACYVLWKWSFPNCKQLVSCLEWLWLG